MAKRKNITCVKFNEVPDGTHFKKGSYTWLTHSTAESYIADGYGVEWNPKKGKPEHAESPTMSNNKDEIIAYLVENDIPHDDDKTKAELLELI